MGGTVRVYRALDRVLKRFVAVKLRRQSTGATRGLWGASTARRAVAALAHPHLVDIYDYGHRGCAAPR